MSLSAEDHEKLREAVRTGIIEALKSDEAKEAVLGAVSAWLDKQSGKAMRKVLAAVTLVIVLNVASFPDTIKSWVTSFGK